MIYDMNGMKRIVLILVMAVLGLCGNVQAQTFRDRSGSYMGKFEGGVNLRRAAAIMFFKIFW